MNFVVVDVETANPDYSSICQIGMVRVQEGTVVDEWETLVDPEQEFDPFNTGLHGIDEASVRNSPNFSECIPGFISFLGDDVLVSHSTFDDRALRKAARNYDIRLDYEYLDSVKIVRRAWPEKYAKDGYGLATVAMDMGIKMVQHHNALEDAKMAAAIVVKACEQKGFDSVDPWHELCRMRVDMSLDKEIENRSPTRDGNPDGVFCGSRILFTGELSIPRNRAADLAASHGFDVASGASKKVNVLVVGRQNEVVTKGEKSSKHRKIEQLIKEGFDIEILYENDFMQLLET